mmetsp:Transcript_17130/g.26526  ORF Transcript_17130/g.26526 Transcript_17130/m.26526 type:complete len:366 (-) Transcript_17130:212-1309(-)
MRRDSRGSQSSSIAHKSTMTYKNMLSITKTEKNTAKNINNNNNNVKSEVQIQKVVWRDATFVLFAVAVTMLTTFVEMNAFDASLRGGSADERGIVDTGYIVTTRLHSWLIHHRHWNDILALLNTLFCVLLPFVYLAYVTLWVGDFDLSFRYLASQILRSICGWLTYLPSSSAYLMSWNDIPHVWQKQLKHDDDVHLETDIAEPFVSFFSGHVATMVICANHMYLHGHKKFGVFFHVLNALQIIRLLATRGHYSIDILIAWYVASHLSRSAGRLGWYYSRGRTLQDWTPSSWRELLERIVGIEGERRSLRYLQLIQNMEEDELLELTTIADDSLMLETTVKLATRGRFNSDKRSSTGNLSQSREKK